MPCVTIASATVLTMCSEHGSCPARLQSESVHHEFHPIGGFLAMPLLYAVTTSTKMNRK